MKSLADSCWRVSMNDKRSLRDSSKQEHHLALSTLRRNFRPGERTNKWLCDSIS